MRIAAAWDKYRNATLQDAHPTLIRAMRSAFMFGVVDGVGIVMDIHEEPDEEKQYRAFTELKGELQYLADHPGESNAPKN